MCDIGLSVFARASLATEYGASRDDLPFAEVAYRVQVVDLRIAVR